MKSNKVHTHNVFSVSSVKDDFILKLFHTHANTLCLAHIYVTVFKANEIDDEINGSKYSTFFTPYICCFYRLCYLPVIAQDDMEFIRHQKIVSYMSIT